VKSKQRRREEGSEVGGGDIWADHFDKTERVFHLISAKSYKQSSCRQCLPRIAIHCQQSEIFDVHSLVDDADPMIVC
jgi:hypothetical protein